MIKESRCINTRSHVLDVAEFVVDFLVEVVEVLAELLFGLDGALELHLSEFDHDVTEGLLDVAHRDLALLLGALCDNADAVLVELDDGLHHAHGLVHGAVEIVLREGVLLEELILDDLRGLKDRLA